MQALYPFFIAFIIIFLAELGDKTQLIILSLASKNKVHNILIGIALGSLFSHGIAIIFGSKLGNWQNQFILHVFKLLTYLMFLLIGLIGFIPKNQEKQHNSSFLQKISNGSLNYILVIALFIIIGEIGDKTFLASIGLGIEYPHYKISLVVGTILGMVISNSVAILFGKLLESHFSSSFIDFLSNIIFVLFGLIGIIMLV